MRPPFRPDWVLPYGLSDFGLGTGAQIGDTTCLPPIVPGLRVPRLRVPRLRALGLRASTLKRTVFIPAHPWSRVQLFGTSLGCLPLRWEGACWRPAPSPLLSPGIPNLLPPVDRRRCNTIKRHPCSPTGVWRPRKSIPRSRRITMQPGHGAPRRELPASTRREHRLRAAKSSIPTN
jgi:hypothetical protein